MFSRRKESQMVEMQMGPMIDIVFLLLVFFMVTAKPIKPESDVGLKLPGTVSQDEAINLPNEQSIVILPSGQVTVNDASIDRPGSRDMPELTKLLTRFRESSQASGEEPLVSIQPQNGAKHQSLIDVLNACAAAEIRGVTIATQDSDQASSGSGSFTF